MRIIQMDFPPGTSIEQVADQMTSEAGKLIDAEVRFSFNGCPLTARRETTPWSIVEVWREHARVKSEAFRVSPEGKQQAADRLAYQQRIEAVAEPGLTVYQYDLDNRDRGWEKVPAEIVPCFELWDGVKYLDVCIGLLPDSWPKDAKRSDRDSPDRRIT